MSEEKNKYEQQIDAGVEAVVETVGELELTVSQVFKVAEKFHGACIREDMILEEDLQPMAIWMTVYDCVTLRAAAAEMLRNTTMDADMALLESAAKIMENLADQAEKSRET